MNKIKAMMGTYPMAADQWMMVIVLISVFGHTVPWYVWLMFGLELASALIAMIAYKVKEKLEGE